MNHLQAPSPRGHADLAARLARTANYQLGAAISETRTNIVLYGLAGVLAVTAFVGAMVAAFLYLAAILSPLIAALALTGASLLMAGMALLWAQHMNARARRRQRLENATRTFAASRVAAIMPHLVRSKSPVSFLALGGAAYLLARLMPEDVER